ncbi:MAG TPA: pyruvate formate lyase family protein, partial [Atribacterota bacterium]|nr:pyruvate formate lyase family protein [Atribacterota bacterium]
MNSRIARLREKSLTVKPFIDIERAQLITEAYQKYQGRVATPILRALAFKHLLENKTITIDQDELIVGERGCAPAATPTYPELCCHTLEDLEIIDQREKISFQVSPEVRKVQKEEIIPFWQERSIRHQIFSMMDQNWLDSYDAGIFTEFMEQRAPGHTVADGKIYREGFLDLQERIKNSIASLDYQNDSQALQKLTQLQAMSICAEAIISLANRYAQLAEELIKTEEDANRKEELITIAEVCRRVPAQSPRNLWEALQMYWFVHIGVISELNTWDSFNPGHLDQHLLPFYRQGLEEGTLDAEKAKELLQCLWIKFNNQPAPPKVGV